MTSPLASHWRLDPTVTFLNHGSFGATPAAVLDHQQVLQARLESEPVRFFQRELEPLLDEALATIGAFVGASADDLAPVANATSGVNAVLRSLRFDRGDELIVTDHAYNACRNALEWVASRQGASVVPVTLPFPVTDEGAVTAILDAVTSRTAVALIDHVTSPTAAVLPIEMLVRRLDELGIDVIVDGAHAPGMVDVDLEAIGAAYYAANCHKWMCAPKGSGFLHVRADRQEGIVPTVVSHGLNSTRSDRSRFRLLFDWVGTDDPTAFLSVPMALDRVREMVPGGWDEVRSRNRSLADRGARILEGDRGFERAALGDGGSMVSLVLPIPPADPLASHPLHHRLFHDHRIEVPVFSWAGRTLVRISAHLYNADDDYERLAGALDIELASAARTAT